MGPMPVMKDAPISIRLQNQWLAEAAVALTQNQVAFIRCVQILAVERKSFCWDGNKKLNNSNKLISSLILPAAALKRPGH